MKRHTIFGGDALVRAEQAFPSNRLSSFLQIGKEFAYSHHEKYDGSGYPFGLEGDQIPLPGRLLALLDIYDALISKRVYKPPFTHAMAVDIIVDGDGRVMPEHFDPDVLQIFKENHDLFRQIALKYADFEEERILLARG